MREISCLAHRISQLTTNMRNVTHPFRFRSASLHWQLSVGQDLQPQVSRLKNGQCLLFDSLNTLMCPKISCPIAHLMLKVTDMCKPGR